MKTSLIDRSLVGLNFREITNKTDVYMYADSLVKAGVNYIELDLNALSRLPKPSGSENYIFRIERPDECVIANALPFAYAVLPLHLSYLISKIQIPIILEVKIGDVDPIILLKIIADNIDLTKVSLLRLLGDFSLMPNQFDELIKKIRSKYAFSIDICPTNNSLMALSSSIIAYAACVNSITLNFGDNKTFASLEEFFFSLATMYRIIINKNYITGICRAAMLLFLIGENCKNNINNIIKHYNINSNDVVLIDGKEKAGDDVLKKRVFSEKRLSDAPFDEELSEKMTEVLKEYSIDFYSNNPVQKKTLNKKEKSNHYKQYFIKGDDIYLN